MKPQMRPLFSLFLILVLLTGFIYPLLVTGLAQVFFPFQANGSLIIQNDQVLGSELIGQEFARQEYFWGRPSATSTNAYNAFNQIDLPGSSGSNLGPLSQALIDNVQSRVTAMVNSHPGTMSLVPVDLVTASASGLDPDISVQAAKYQVSRIAKARGLSEETVTQLVDQFSINRQFGLLGEPRVNVLMLNIALDGIK